MTKQTPWAVLLCRFKDTDQVNIPLGLTNKLFTSTGNGTFNVPRFFSDVSHGLLDLSGSQVFPQSPEYFTVDAYLNDYVAPTDPPPLGWQAKITRDQLISKAWKAAENAGVPLKQFSGGIVVVFNAAIGITFGGGSSVGPFACSDFRWTINNGTSSHGQEMAHGYGLGHSRRDGSVVDYTDSWDIMSTGNAFMAKDTDFVLRGPGMNAANMRYLGWLDTTRVWRGSAGSYDEVVQLRPLFRRDLPGPLAAEFPPFGKGFLVEYRVKEDWDAAIPRSAVLVHDFYGGHSYLMSSTNGQPDLVQGDIFDPYAGAPFLPHPRVEVLNIDNENHTATIRFSFTPAQPFPADWYGIFSQVFGQIAVGGRGVVWNGHRFVPVPPRNPMARLLDSIAEWVTAEDVTEPFLPNAIRRHALKTMEDILASAARDLEPIRVPALEKPGAPQLFRISGRIINQQTCQGVIGLRVEAWDKDLIFNDLVGSAMTDTVGAFRIEFSAPHFQECFLDRRPDLFFKIFRGDALIHSTEDAVLWNVDKGEAPVVIAVE
jgi:hypothetical protein